MNLTDMCFHMPVNTLNLAQWLYACHISDENEISPDNRGYTQNKSYRY